MGRKEALYPDLPLSPGNYRHMGSAHAAIRSPKVWYAPGIDPPISCLRLGCPHPFRGDGGADGECVDGGGGGVNAACSLQGSGDLWVGGSRVCVSGWAQPPTPTPTPTPPVVLRCEKEPWTTLQDPRPVPRVQWATTGPEQATASRYCGGGGRNGSLGSSA